MAESKKKPRTKKTSPAKKSSAQPAASSRNPVLILAILALLTIIVLMYAWKMPGKLPTVEKAASKTVENSTQKKSETSDAKKVTAEKTVDVKPAVPPDAVPVKKTVKIYLLSFNEVTEKIALVSVNRTVMHSGETVPIEEALRELTKGPNAGDEKKGFITTVPPQLKIRSVKITGNIAVVDVNESFLYNAHGDIISSRIKQIVYTATQFPGVDSVTLKVNGETKTTFGGDGLIFTWPMKRK